MQALNSYFGEPWDAPVCDSPAQQAATPVGEPCHRCGEPIADGDQGHLMGAMAADGTGRVVAIHRECQVIGILGHTVGVCTCTGWDTTSREAAREALRRLER